MILSDTAGPAILGWHPQHGIRIEGTLQRDAAQRLAARGFHPDPARGDILVMTPAGAGAAQTTIGDPIAWALQALSYTGHHVYILPTEHPADMPLITRAQDAVTTLIEQRARLLAAITNAHPAQDCLPVPPLRIPHHRPDFAALGRAVGTNLDPRAGAPAPRWRHAREHCRHASPGVVIAIGELLHRWELMLQTAEGHIHPDRGHTQHDLACAVDQITQAVTALPATPPGNLALAPATVADLTDGDVFSLDSGHTWHVCCAAWGDVVSTYTAEREDDGDGEPLTVRIPAQPDQPCLVRTALPMAPASLRPTPSSS